jgi:hypothetical protein
MIRASKST